MLEEHPLRVRRRPRFEQGVGSLRVVDLFAGCGGLSLGVAEAARDYGVALDVRLAVDFEKAAADVFRSNFPQANVQIGAVEEYFDGELGSALTPCEERTLSSTGTVDLLIGGPPCQGHSNLNNHTRRDDPKNRLYLRMVRAAEVLRPKAIVIENVPAVVNDKQRVVDRAISWLSDAGYCVDATRMDLRKLGVAQSRQRHIILAVRKDLAPLEVARGRFLKHLQEAGPERDLRWAIGDLVEIAPKSFFDEPSRVSGQNRRRMAWLFGNGAYDLPNYLRPMCHQGEHRYTSAYGRLRWDRPAQTITSGFATMGGGRFVHPSLHRCLTPHEAARIQGFPDYYRLVDQRRVPDFAMSRTKLQTIIGNAVPPALSRAIIAKLFNEEGFGATAGFPSDVVGDILCRESVSAH